MPQKLTNWACFLCTSLTLWACQPGDAKDTDSASHRVVATTTMLEDLTRELAGDDIAVSGIMQPGGDPHLYKPTPSDARLIARSDLVITNGLKLEGWIDDLVRNAGGGARVIVATKGIEALKDPSRTNYPDPHVWHDVELWKIAVGNVRDALIELEPAHSADITARAESFINELSALDAEVKASIGDIPEDHRILVTSHDAFNYYGARYGLKVVAVQGLSTESEAGARDVARVVDVVKAAKLPAIFVENSVNPKLIEQISRETGATIGGTLYSDSLGDAEGPGATYTGMIRENTRLIHAALSKAAPATGDTTTPGSEDSARPPKAQGEGEAPR